MSLKDFLKRLFGQVKDKERHVVVDEIAIGASIVMHAAVKQMMRVDTKLPEDQALSLIMQEYNDVKK